MQTVCQENLCTGCGACKNVCGHQSISIVDSLKNLNAIIDTNICVGCNACYNICPVNFPVLKREPIFEKQGWVREQSKRGKSSSGGLACAFARGFMNNAGVVYACVFENGLFNYKKIQSEDEISKIAGSKYVKSDIKNIYKNVLTDLAYKKKVLIIGLPCHIAGIKKYIGNKLEENLYTIDLICHGTPSNQILIKYLKEQKIDINQIRTIAFRKKENIQLFIDNKPIFSPKGQDEYTFAFLNGLTYTENCYQCVYADEKRISDITLGDSWGSDLNQEEKEKGISLCLIQTLKGKNLLDFVDLTLFDVDFGKAKQNNPQLRKPAKKPIEREKFFDLLKKNSVKKSVLLCYPKRVFRNYLSLIKNKIIR